MTATRIPIAVTQAPTIICPPWCTVTREEHVEDLPNLEGFVLHRSAEQRGEGWTVDHTRSAYIDGTLDPEDPQQVAALNTSGLSLDAAEAFARAILNAAEEARA